MSWAALLPRFSAGFAKMTFRAIPRLVNWDQWSRLLAFPAGFHFMALSIEL